MNRQFPLVILLATLAVCSSPAVSYAQGSRQELSSQAQKELGAIQELLSRNEYQAALDALNKLVPALRGKQYDLAVAYQTLGYVYSSMGRHTEAQQAFSNALAANALPADVSHEIEYNVAQLLISDGKYADGMKHLANWFRSEKNPPADAHYLAATAYYFMDDFKQLVFQARNALSKRPDAPASWYDLLLAGYYEIDDMNAAGDLLETMIDRFPEQTQYWNQLAGIYLSNNKPKQALALMELSYLKGITRKQPELMQLAQTYLYLDMPYKAATLLSSEISKGNIQESPETVRLLADSWFLARETGKGIEILEKAVGRFPETDLLFRLGQLYVSEEDWQKAVQVLNRVVEKDNFTSIADAWLLLGIAALQGDDKVVSYRALNNALRYDSTRNQAGTWLAELRK